MYVYAYYNNNREVLYVGSTQHVLNRFQTHKKDDWWMDEVASIKIWGPYNYDEGLVCEKVLISKLHPKYNKKIASGYYGKDAPILHHNGVWFENFDDAKEYFNRQPAELKRCTYYVLNEDDEALRWLCYYSGESISEMVREFLRKGILEKATKIGHPDIYEKARIRLTGR